MSEDNSNLIRLDTINVDAACMVCGGYLKTSAFSKPLCARCRAEGIRTVDDERRAFADGRGGGLRIDLDDERIVEELVRSRTSQGGDEG